MGISRLKVLTCSKSGFGHFIIIIYSGLMASIRQSPVFYLYICELNKNY